MDRYFSYPGINNKTCWIFLVGILLSFTVHAQLKDILLREETKYDSSYYQSFNKKLTGRIYFDRRYTNFKLEAPANGPLLKYRSNTFLNVGIGATYRLFTLNLGFGLNFLNHDKNKGETHYLNLQTQWYGRNLIIDLFGQFYRGYYLSPRGYGSSNDNYYVQPNLKVDVGGVSAYRLFNGRQFSYRGVILQNEWQKKSAGSFLAGGAVYYGIVKNDSAFVPKSLDSAFNRKAINYYQFLKIGPGGGYAYTFVYKENYFLTGSITATLDLGYSYEEGSTSHASRTELKPNFIYRLAGGYNSNRWNASISFVGNDLRMPGAYSSYKYVISTGSLRLTVAKRFSPGKALRKQLKPLDNLIVPPVVPLKN